MNAPHVSRLGPRRQAGLTIVELLVAMVVGLSVIGAGLAMYVSSGSSGRSSNQVAQMSEDANAALSILRMHVAMAGYSKPVSVSSTGLTKAYDKEAIFGCQNGLDSSSGDKLITNSDAVTCASGGPSSKDTLIVMYEADESNTVPAKGKGTDCLGAAIVENVLPNGGGAKIAVAENRFYVNAAGSLLCKGNGGSTAVNIPQPLVDNIADFGVMYGVASEDKTKGIPGTVAERYLTAGEVGTIADPQWKNVVSVRLCVIVRSEENTLDDVAAPFKDCHGNTVTPSTWGSPAKADKRAYRTFTSTVVLHNRAQQTL